MLARPGPLRFLCFIFFTATVYDLLEGSLFFLFYFLFFAATAGHLLEGFD